MPSRALTTWFSESRRALDEIAAAHRAVGRRGPGRRFAAQQINQAYVVLLSSQFQRFCRDLHTDCVNHLLAHPALQPFEAILHPRFVDGRRLDAGNPNPGNIGSDFGRLGVKFWDGLRRLDRHNEMRQHRLESMNHWRNAIAHQDFRSPHLGGRSNLRFMEVRQMRAACNRLAVDMDRMMYAYLIQTTGAAPW
jgi:hypothetical protein